MVRPFCVLSEFYFFTFVLSLRVSSHRLINKDTTDYKLRISLKLLPPRTEQRKPQYLLVSTFVADCKGYN